MMFSYVLVFVILITMKLVSFVTLGKLTNLLK